MSNVTFLDSKSMNENLRLDLAVCKHFVAVVSYIKSSGIEILETVPSERRPISTIITCTDFSITDSDALNALIDLQFQVRLTRNKGLHAKLWVLSMPDPESFVVYVGSSNVTFGGYNKNFEANIRTTDLQCAKDALAFFQELARNECSFLPQKDWIKIYAEKSKEFQNLKYQIDEVPLPPIPPLRAIEKASVYEKLVWYPREANKQLLSQGIISDIVGASGENREMFIELTKGGVNVRLILLENNANQPFSIFRDIETATITTTSAKSSRQLGAGRRDVLAWLNDIWNFPVEVAKTYYQNNSFKKWNDYQKWCNKIKYEVAIDVWSRPSLTIYVRPN